MPVFLPSRRKMSTRLKLNLTDSTGSKIAAPVHDIPLWAFLTSAGLLIASFFLDNVISNRMPPEGTRFGDLHHLLRSLGYLPTWFFVGILLVTSAPQNLRKKRWSAAVFINLTAIVTGIFAELLKILVRRSDPMMGMESSWKRVPWSEEWWDGSDLCFPSGHAAVAWGAAIAISRRWPGTTPWMMLLAAGCASGRVQARGHNPSDVIASLLLALLVSWWIDKSTRKATSTPKTAPPAIPQPT
jgi:membrane-associated phospholipid phosphatase